MLLLGTLYTSPSKEPTLPLNRPLRTLVLLVLVGLIRASKSDLYWFVFHSLTAFPSTGSAASITQLPARMLHGSIAKCPVTVNRVWYSQSILGPSSPLSNLRQWETPARLRPRRRPTGPPTQ